MSRPKLPRDPRRNSQTGDIFRKGRLVRHFIGWRINCEGITALYTTPSLERRSESREVPEYRWNAWVKDAEVLYASK